MLSVRGSVRLDVGPPLLLPRHHRHRILQHQVQSQPLRLPAAHAELPQPAGLHGHLHLARHGRVGPAAQDMKSSIVFTGQSERSDRAPIRQSSSP